MIAKMKSVCASGSAPHFSFDPPRPTPHQPPEASANLPCRACSPAPSGSAWSGCSQSVMRCIRYGVRVDHRTATSSPAGADGQGEQPGRGAGDPQQRAEDRRPGSPRCRGRRRAGPARAPRRRPAPAAPAGASTGASSRSLRASRSAPQRTSASLASSDGWIRNGPPKSSQLRLPLTSVPATATRHEQRQRGRPCRGRPASRQARTGSRDASNISGSPMTTHIACLLTIASDEPRNGERRRRSTPRTP